MNKTKIEWVKNPDGTQGYTLNPMTGCRNHDEKGFCLGGGFPCYAYGLANGRLKARYLANKNVAPGYTPIWKPDYNAYQDPFYPRFWPERLEELGENLLWLRDSYQAKGIFVCDMSDLFGIGVPEGWTKEILFRISQYKRHRFYLLTKQPQNLAKFSSFPDNCWVGVTACNQVMLQKALSSEGLAFVKAKTKFISFEPLLQRMDGLADYLYCVNWVIIGAQTKPYRPPKVEWVEEIVGACDRAGVPVFLKDNLKPLIFNDWISSQYALDRGLLNWGGELRQELPK